MKVLKVLSTFVTAMLLTATPLAASDQSPKDNAPSQEQMANGVGQRTTHPGSSHLYVGTTLFGDQVEIEDGSLWTTDPEDRYKLQFWYSGDSLLLMQNIDGWFSKPLFPYKLYNQRTLEAIDVKIHPDGAPAWNGFYTHYIMDIYTPVVGDGWLQLNDGTVWLLKASQRKVWDVWTKNDTVIIGTNGGSWVDAFFTPDMLVNVTCSVEFVTSRCLN
jgi:hypothetical protein